MKLIGSYEIVRKIGAGAMGEVFLAQDTRLRRDVAIKLLSTELTGNEEQRRRFLLEARAAASLSHPGVCVIHEIGETDEKRPFIAMEYLEGQSLEERLEEGPVSVEDAIDIVRQVAEALEAAHSRGVVHRDIKPANIHLGPRQRVKVLDFGLAKRFGEAADEGSQLVSTQAGTLLGTPAYMSPEQALGRKVDPRSDLFGLGAVFYHLLTGRLPFSAETIGQLLDRVVHSQPDAIARFNYDVPEEVERIVLKLLAKDPDRRFQTARGLLVDLEDARGRLRSAGEREPGTAPSSALPDSLAPGSHPPATAPEAFETVDVGGSTVGHGSTANVPGGTLESSNPELIATSDVVITYAPLDDQPSMEGRDSWVSQFHSNLSRRVAQLSGREVSVFKQPDPSGFEEIEAQVLEKVPSVKTVVSVLSPPFAMASGCWKVVEEFWKSAESAGRFVVKDHARLLNVVKTPVEADDIPGQLSPLFSRLPSYEFFERDKDSGRVREFDEVFGEAAKQRFYERVYDVAFDLSRVLKHLGESNEPIKVEVDAKPGFSPRKVYLAVTTSDLEHQRDLLRRELTEAGCEVFPKQGLPFVASEIETVVTGCLEQCDIAIHFVGGHYGLVPEATDLSIVALQHQVASRFVTQNEIPQVVWQPRGVVPLDDRQARFLKEIEEGHSGGHLVEVISDNLENLKVLLRRRWEKEDQALEAAARAAQAAQAKPKRVSDGNAPPRVYLICDRVDEEAIEALEDYFYDKGVEVSLPGFDADEAEVQEIHIKNLRDCDGALVFYGNSGMHWADFNVRDLQKAAGYREGRPISSAAVYLAPPFNRRKERFRSVATEVIRQEAEELATSALEAFIEALRASRKEAGR